MLTRSFRAWAVVDAQSEVVNNIVLRNNSGQTPFLTGFYTNPKVLMRISRDGGRTWGAWRQRNLGDMGAYREHVRWAGCGMASFPGMMIEIRVTDPVPFITSGLKANEPVQGR